MTDMSRVTFTADGTQEPSGPSTDTLMVMVSNTIGGGTLNVKKYSEATDGFVTVAQYTAVTTKAEEIKVGRGRSQCELTGATGPNLNVDYWSV